VDEPKLQAAYEVRRARAKTLPDQPPAYSAAASGVLSDMVETAGGFGSAYIGTQHLLLALSRARREVAATLLNDNGVSPEEIIAMLRRLDVVLHAGDDDAA
ncbi:MAG TPA: Clp protease N-terminal domain-containing protein, partial [Longimicrobium sp.]|nr:Clp protease N-terminal domain-containing protein [Longimicrobium sp.]